MAQEQVRHFSSIEEYCVEMGVRYWHPLVSVIDMSEMKPIKGLQHSIDFYGLFLKDERDCDLIYGRKPYDYRKGSVVCMGPGQVIGVEESEEPFQPVGWALLFHPDLAYRTHLAGVMKDYTFFSYEVNEALYLSEYEREMFIRCLLRIQDEVENAEPFSERLIVKNIELLLDYCLRFYERQFTMHYSSNRDVIVRFDALLDKYIESDELRQKGIPTVRYCAGELFLSANYFGDLVKRATGKTALEYIRYKMVNVVKEKLTQTRKTVTEIAYDMGFQYPQHLTRMFRREVGLSPLQYRKRQRKESPV